MRRTLVEVAALAGLALACGGGGGGGGPVGPDVTPPGVPVSSRIVVEPPVPSSLARLTGSSGAVENSSTVRLSNVSAAQRTGQPVTATALSSGDGSFSVSVPAQLGDMLEVTAADAAGNVSGALSLRAGPVPTNLSVGQTGANQLLTLASGEGAFHLPFPAGSERYTLVIQSLNPGPGTFPVSVSGSEQVALRSLAPSAATNRAGETLEGRFREEQRRAASALGAGGLAPSRRLQPADDPALGSTRAFNVVNRLSGFSLTTRSHFDIVTARLLYKGDHTLIYVDERVPNADVPDEMMQAVGGRFDQQTYDIDRAAFGNESDIDANGRVIVLMTATVNALNTEQTIDQGIVTGFFFAIDLIDIPLGNPFGNDAEIFYTLAPDPDREFGAATVTVGGLTQGLHAVLAHEFEHMISAAARVNLGLLEDVWLDEGLAHYAETLNDLDEGDQQNVLRAGLYLQEPQEWSLVGPDAALQERGAAWLLVRYLAEQNGPAVIRQLVQSGLVGIHNVEITADTSFPFLFHLFASALLLDGQGLTGDPTLAFPALDVRTLYQQARALFAGFNPPEFLGPFLELRAATLPGGSIGSVSLKGSSAAYFDVGASRAGPAPMLLRASPQSSLQVTVIRTQ
jgi:hypothetical protein